MPYTINHGNVARLLWGKTFYPDMIPIYPELRRRAEAVAKEAKIRVGKDTGRTAASIDVTDRREGPYWWFRIEAHTRYAYYHHQGTRPHIIEGSLEFRSGGKMTHARIVHHPGTKPNPFLKEALPAFFHLREATMFRPVRLL